MIKDLMLRAGVQYQLAVPAPEPEAPPGAATFLRGLNWVYWGALVLSVLAFMVVGVSMLFAHRNGADGEVMKKLGFVMAGSVIIGAASGLAAAATTGG